MEQYSDDDSLKKDDASSSYSEIEMGKGISKKDHEEINRRIDELTTQFNQFKLTQ